MKIKPRLIIGLGNPSKEYEKTYHNAGFLFIDFLAEKGFEKGNLFVFTKDKNFVLIKPLVFMNESGRATSNAIKYFSSTNDKIRPEEVMIAHDDSDIALGDYKISFGKSSAGHRGVESIIKSLNTQNFGRLRIGIRKTGLFVKTQRAKAEEFVLKKISPKDLKKMSENFAEIKETLNV